MFFDRTELAIAAHHLAFDIHHFRFYARLHKEGRLTAFGPAVHQAFLYSLLLHFRILLDFFYKEPLQDDCCVGHFRALPEFEAAFPPAMYIPPVGARDVSVNLNKRLAHMTATRWREKQPHMAYYTDSLKESKASSLRSKRHSLMTCAKVSMAGCTNLKRGTKAASKCSCLLYCAVSPSFCCNKLFTQIVRERVDEDKRQEVEGCGGDDR